MERINKSITTNQPADFSPNLGNYVINGEPFRFWCQKVLPLVYDDSLSYYELLCKVVNYLNKTMQDVSVMGGDITDISIAYNQLQEYVNNYFTNLDVQEEINKKLEEMLNSGKLNNSLLTFFNGRTVIINNSNKNLLFNDNVREKINYVISENLTIDKEYVIKNLKYSTITLNQNCEIMLTNDNAGIILNETDGLILNNLLIKSNTLVEVLSEYERRYTKGYGQYLLKCVNSVRNTFNNCNFFNSGGDGVVLIKSHMNTFNNCSFRDSFSNGVFLKIEVVEPNIVFNECFFNRNQKNGCVTEVSQVYFNNSVFQFNESHLLIKALDSFNTNTYNIVINGCDLENSKNDDIVFSTNVNSNIYTQLINSTIANLPKNITNILNLDDVTNKVINMEIKNCYTSNKKLSSNDMKLSSSSFIDNTTIPFVYITNLDTRGIFKTRLANYPIHLSSQTREEVVATPNMTLLEGTLTITMDSPINAISYVNKQNRIILFTPNENKTVFTLNINSPFIYPLIVDYGNSQPTQNLVSSLFEGVYSIS